MTMRFAALLSLLFASSLLLAASAEPQAICRGLALQGGSDKGAYQAGALKGLFDIIGAEEMAYDVISGVTIGSMNLAWLSQYGKGMEEPMIDQLINFWLTVKPSNMYKNWLGGPIQGLLFESSLYNAEPGMQYLKTHITQPPQRYVAVGAANVNNGQFKVFHNFEKNFQTQEFLDAVMASNGIAGIFPYQNIKGDIFFDGSVLKSLDVSSVVHKCRELTGGKDENIVIDMVLLAGKKLSSADVTKFNSLQVLIRTLEIMSYHDSLIGFIRAQQTFPKVQFRYVITPSSPLPSGDLPMSFDHKEIFSMIEMGKKDAKEQVAMGPGAGFQQKLAEAQQTSMGKLISQANKAQQEYLEQLALLEKELKGNQSVETVSI